jgi:phosphoglycolate phosphatase-like HAD superfamily hydrolase
MMIFDFDGTIADTIQEGLQIVNELAPKYGFDVIDAEKADSLRDLGTREVVRRVGIRPRSIPGFLSEAKSKLRERMERIKPFRGIPESLRTLCERDVRLGILTSNSRANVEMFLEKWELRGLFDFLETGSPIFGKARLLRRILEKSSSGERAIYVGDETRDIVAARRVGVRSAAVCWGANSRAALEELEPDFLLEHPSDLVPLASGLGEGTGRGV